MEPSQQEDQLISSPETSTTTSTSLDISPSSYLQVPQLSFRSRRSRTRPIAFDQANSPAVIASSSQKDPLDTATPLEVQFSEASPEQITTPTSLRSRPSSPFQGVYMSVYSSSSYDTEHSEYSNPPARRYKTPDYSTMSGRKITAAQKAQYIQALQDHQVNTLVELRRIEKAFAILGTPDCSQPMTSAWSYYVNSHGLLTELRGLTRNYPFSSDCLDEAKRRVYSDPSSNRSWNFCWLVLKKIQSDQLVPYYARYQASLPVMWGGHQPTEEQITQLANAFITEWNYALGQMLRHWEQPPTR